LKRWAAFAKFRDDGRICRSNAAAGQAARGIDLGQGNWTFSGSDAGGRG
jgi:transposase